jgi:hypothetical protein
MSLARDDVIERPMQIEPSDGSKASLTGTPTGLI